jgi:hypothetical protein
MSMGFRDNIVVRRFVIRARRDEAKAWRCLERPFDKSDVFDVFDSTEEGVLTAVNFSKGARGVSLHVE